LIDTLEARSLLTPAEFVPQDNAYLQLAWDFLAIDYVPTSLAVKIQSPFSIESLKLRTDILHADNIFTFSRALLIAQSQARVYTGLSRFCESLLALSIHQGPIAIPARHTEARIRTVLTCDVTECLKDMSVTIQNNIDEVRQTALPRTSNDCTTFINEVQDGLNNWIDAGVPEADQLGRALFEHVMNKMPELLNLHLLQEMVNELLRCLSTLSGCDSEAEMQPFQLLENIECDLECLLRQVLDLLIHAYRGGAEVRHFSNPSDTRWTYRPSPEDLEHLSKAHRLCWLMEQVNNTEWPLTDRISSLSNHLISSREAARRFDEFDTAVLIAKRLLKIILSITQVLSILQPMGSKRWRGRFRPGDGAFQTLTSWDAIDLSALDQKVIVKIWSREPNRNTRVDERPIKVWAKYYALVERELRSQNLEAKRIEFILNAIGKDEVTRKTLLGKVGSMSTRHSPSIGSLVEPVSRRTSLARAQNTGAVSVNTPTQPTSAVNFGEGSQESASRPVPFRPPGPTETKKRPDKRWRTTAADEIPSTQSQAPAEPIEPPQKLLFSDAHLYALLRTIFPQPGTNNRFEFSNWTDLRVLLTSPPFNFIERATPKGGGVSYKVTRRAADGYPEATINFHRPHKDKVEKEYVNNWRKRFGDALGWRWDSFGMVDE
jgi:hypothetical protein